MFPTKSGKDGGASHEVPPGGAVSPARPPPPCICCMAALSRKRIVHSQHPPIFIPEADGPTRVPEVSRRSACRASIRRRRRRGRNERIQAARPDHPEGGDRNDRSVLLLPWTIRVWWHIRPPPGGHHYQTDHVVHANATALPPPRVSRCSDGADLLPGTVAQTTGPRPDKDATGPPPGACRRSSGADLLPVASRKYPGRGPDPYRPPFLLPGQGRRAAAPTSSPVPPLLFPAFPQFIRCEAGQNGVSPASVAATTNFATTFLPPALSKAMSSLSPSMPRTVP